MQRIQMESVRLAPQSQSGEAAVPGVLMSQADTNFLSQMMILSKYV